MVLKGAHAVVLDAKRGHSGPPLAIAVLVVAGKMKLNVG
jgi:hypothetical protein